ncbi:UNVERIFIED_CONTAM: hypothetical protein Sradi_2095400 [Sesamum radiatum]|uniref:Uncharacterized protein n=1 Tax=Sesamum radiatum TaxID=300843 RepID=A0AAW2TLM9_SESRA
MGEPQCGGPLEVLAEGSSFFCLMIAAEGQGRSLSSFFPGASTSDRVATPEELQVTRFRRATVTIAE